MNKRLESLISKHDIKVTTDMSQSGKVLRKGTGEMSVIRGFELDVMILFFMRFLSRCC